LYTFNPSSNEPLYMQLYNQLKNEIQNSLFLGDKLPSIRKIAQEYNLSKNTVESAYRQLYAEGYIESRPKSGYFVSSAETPLTSPRTKMHQNGQESENKTYIYDFFPARLCRGAFPLKLYKRLFNKAVDASLDFGGYPDSQGELGLRCEIARYLSASRGVRCDPQQLFVLSGFSDAMGLIARILQQKTDTLAIEDPYYHVAKDVFEDYGYRIQKIPVDANGISLEQLESSDTQLVYITPSHQYPTGVTMPIDNRVRLLRWADKNGVFIIEDDYDSELTYHNRPVPSLQGLDNNDNVIYIGTFSKALSPALRVSYMVLPIKLLSHYQQRLKMYNYIPHVSIDTQKTLEFFMREGHWERHLRKMRTMNRKKHDLMKESLQNTLKDSMQIVSQGGGLAISITPVKTFDFQKLAAKCENEKIKIYFAHTCDGREETILMGFGGLKEEQIPKAVKAFGSIWFECFS
jgi:GntR family transcriptional regulator / MocR family aminotransferase